MYEAMARRYRPSTFAEVIGQEHVARTLQNAINADRVAHAYLFCGPHGCGKTSMARIFARALVCEAGPTDSPCGTCDLCRDVARGLDVDVQEIDGASNNGVEQVRQLREQAGYVPTRARFKIYIIDEVHMLSVAAFNALLKTLEEPPGHVKFILATTDPHRLPETVLSRTQRFDFRLVPAPTLAVFFKDLVARENAAISEEAVEAVAAFSGGSVRDGLVLLDQLLSYAQGEVGREDVERVRGVAGAETVAGLFQAVVRHDVVEALRLVDEVAARGTNVGDFLDQLIEFGRDLMHWVVTGSGERVTAYGPARTALTELAGVVGLDQALLILDVFSAARTRVRMRALTNPLVPLEMAVARLAGLDSIRPVGEVLQKLDALARGAPLPPAGSLPQPPASAEPRPAPASSAGGERGGLDAANPRPLATAEVATSVGGASASVQLEEPARSPFADVPAHGRAGPGADAGADGGADTDAGPGTARAADRPPWDEDVGGRKAGDNEASRGAGADAADPAAAPVARPLGLAAPTEDDRAGGSDDEAGEDEAPPRDAQPSGVTYEATRGPDSAPPRDAPPPVRDEGSGVGDTAAGWAHEGGVRTAADAGPSATTERAAEGAGLTISDLETVWQRALDALAQSHRADLAFLRDVYIDRIQGAEVTLSVPGGGSFIFEQLEDGRRKGRLASCIGEILGRPVQVLLTMREAGVGDRVPETPEVERSLERSSPEARLRREAQQDDGVRLVVDAFEGEVVNIENEDPPTD